MTVSVNVQYAPKINWSLARAGVPIIRRLRVTNLGEERRSVTLRVWIPQYCDPADVAIGDLEPGEQTDVELTSALPERFDMAMLVPHSLRTYIVVSAANAHLRFPLELLMPDEWAAGVTLRGGRLECDSTLEWCAAGGVLPPGGVCLVAERVEERWTGVPPLQAAVAALVMPQHPLVEHVKVQAQRALRRPVNECAATEVVEAVFEQIAPFMLFPDIEKYGLEQRSQRIRLPGELLGRGDEPVRGGTCIDWALLMAGALEACGRSPLLLLLELTGHTMHALVGCWKSGPEQGPPVITSASRIGSLLGRSMVVADVMEAARGGGWAEAEARAEALLRSRDSDARFVYAVDIELARGRAGGAGVPRIAPLPHERRAQSASRDVEQGLAALEDSVEFRAGFAERREGSMEHLSAQAVVEDRWPGNAAEQPLVLICHFPADVKQTMEALVFRGRLAERDIERTERPRSHETLDAALRQLEARLGHHKAAPAVAALDLSNWPDGTDTEAMWRRIAAFWTAIAAWEHWLVVGVPRPVALGSGAYADLRPQVYSSSPLFDGRYAHRAARFEARLPPGVVLGPTLKSLLTINSPAAVDLLLNAVSPAGGGVLEPRADDPASLEALTMLAARFDRAGFHEIAYRLELACAAACDAVDVEPLSADVRVDGCAPDHVVVEYVDDVKWLPATVRFGRMLGGAGAGKSTALGQIERFWCVPPAEARPSGDVLRVPVRIVWDGISDPDRALQGTFARRGVLATGGRTYRLECHQRLARCAFAGAFRLLVSPPYVLIDGVDSLHPMSNESAATFASAIALSGGGLLIASRSGEPLDFGLSAATEIKDATLRPLRADQLRRFVAARRPELADRMFEPRHTAMRHIAATPETLAFMCQAPQAAAVGPYPLVGAVQGFVSARLDAAGSCRPDLEEWLPAQASSVLHSSSRRVRVADRDQELLEAGVRARLLRPQGPGVLEFSASIVADYFAAMQLLRDIDRVGTRAALEPVAGKASAIKARWRGCFALLGGLAASGRRSALLGQIALIDPLLGSFCLAGETGEGSGTELDETRANLAALLAGGAAHPGSSAEIARALGWRDPRVAEADPVANLVRVESGLWLARYPVTNLEYARFVEDGGYRKRQYWPESAATWWSQGIGAPDGWQDRAADHPNHPVTGVSFHEAVAYCRWLSARVADVHFQLPSAIEWDRAAFPVDPVPHEPLAEWLFDARLAALQHAVTSRERPNPAPRLMRHARQLDSLLTPLRDAVERHRPQLTCAEAMPIGVFPPNEIGLYDLFGAVWEWCDSGPGLDPAQRPSSRQAPLEDPVVAKGGPAPVDFDHTRVVLGGYFDPGTRFERLGFRLAARTAD